MGQVDSRHAGNLGKPSPQAEDWGVIDVAAKLSGKRFLFIGRAGMDLYADLPSPCTENAEHFFACLGGSSINIAVALTRLGCQTSLVTCVADTHEGYHPCAVLPGCEMYYFAILGGISQRSLKQYFQPTHARQLKNIPGIMDMVAKFK